MKKDLEKEIVEKFNEQADQFPTDLSIHQSEFDLIEKILSPIKNKKILDVGCGKGRFVKAMQEKGAEALGIEPSIKLIEEGKKCFPKINIQEGSATKIAFPDNEFDAVICVEVLEHIPDFHKAIQEMRRVLKPGGIMIIIDKNLYGFSQSLPMPSAFEKWLLERRNKWMYPKDFGFREIWFSPHGLRKEIAKVGFEKNKVDYLSIHPKIWHKIKPLSYLACWSGIKK